MVHDTSSSQSAFLLTCVFFTRYLVLQERIRSARRNDAISIFAYRAKCSSTEKHQAGTLTAKTLTKRFPVAKDWAEIRRRGHGINEISIMGVFFSGSPIFDSSHSIGGSISIGIPKPRYSTELGKKIAVHLKDACRRLSLSLEKAGCNHVNSNCFSLLESFEFFKIGLRQD